MRENRTQERRQFVQRSDQMVNSDGLAVPEKQPEKYLQRCPVCLAPRMLHTWQVPPPVTTFNLIQDQQAERVKWHDVWRQIPYSRKEGG